MILQPRAPLAAHEAHGGRIEADAKRRLYTGTTHEGRPFSLQFDDSGKLVSWTFDGRA